MEYFSCGYITHFIWLIDIGVDLKNIRDKSSLAITSGAETKTLSGDMNNIGEANFQRMLELLCGHINW